MKDYYNIFIDLSLQQCLKDDYTNELKVKNHNKASKQLKRLQNEMKKNNVESILSLLLIHKDERVRINAASLCLQMKILVDQAVKTLEEIIKISSDSTICFSAKMILCSKDNAGGK